MRRMRSAKVGIDYSKATANICVLFGAKRYDGCFANTPKIGQELLKWLKDTTGSKKFDIFFEPTGRYSELLSEYLWLQKNVRMYQVNPEQVSHFQKSIDVRSQTDVKAAYALARYGVERSDILKEWAPKTHTNKELRDIQMLMRSTNKRIVALKCQLKCGVRFSYVEEEIKKELDRLEEQKDRWLDVAARIIKSDEMLANDLALLDSIPGIAERTAVLLLCFIDFRSFKTSRGLAAFLGLTVRQKESGATVKEKERLCKKGTKHVRAGLFCPVWSAIQGIPELQEFYNRLLSAGKHAHLAQAACMRKVITIAWSLIRDQRPFDPNYKNPHFKPI